MKYTRIYAGNDGESHMEDVETDLAPVDFAPPAPPMDCSAPIAASTMIFLRVPGGWYGEPHPTPRRQFGLILGGEGELSVTDGTTRHCVSGSLFLLEDTSGKGHDLRALGTHDLLMAAIGVTD